MFRMIEEIESPKFNIHFWEWFDSQPKEFRDKFNYYPSDMARIFYYNKIWKFTKPS